MVEPVHPLQRRVLHRVYGFPRSPGVNDLGLEQTDHRFGRGVVVRVSRATNRALKPRITQPFGMADSQVLATPIAVMDDAFGVASNRGLTAPATGTDPQCAE